MENLKARLQEIITKKEAQLAHLEATTPEVIDCPILECEIDDAKAIVEYIDSTQDIDDKLNSIEGVLNTTTSGTIYDTVKAYLDQVVCLETYGTYIEEGDIQYIKVVAVTKPFLSAFAHDEFEWTLEEFLGEYTWDNTEGIDALAQEHGALVGVCER